MAQSADSTRLCEICIGGPGENYCQQCGQLFCGNCKLSHLRAKISKKHTFLSGQNINKEEKLLCPEHEESFLFCCHDCDTPVCRFCSVEKHSRHLMTDLTKYAEKQKNELLKIIKSKATTSSSYMGKIKEDANIFREKTKAVIKNITEQGNYCNKLIDKKVHSFVKLVQDEEQKILQSMSTDTQVYLGIIEKCQQWQNNIKEMETTADVILLKKLKHIKTDVDQIVLGQSPDIPKPSVSYTNKKLSDTDIDNLFGEFGCPSRRTNVCPTCESKNQHMYRYKSERDNLKEDKNGLEKHLAHLAGERNDLTHQLQKIQMEKYKFIEQVKSLETQIRNAEPDETSSLKAKSLENTIKNQKQLILEIQKRSIQHQNEFSEAEQVTKETAHMLRNCREEKNAIKNTLLERELENDKLQCEKEQLNQRLKMQKEHAEEQIYTLKKKLKEKEEELQQSKQINDELNKKE